MIRVSCPSSIMKAKRMTFVSIVQQHPSSVRMTSSSSYRYYYNSSNRNTTSSNTNYSYTKLLLAAASCCATSVAAATTFQNHGNYYCYDTIIPVDVTKPNNINYPYQIFDRRSEVTLLEAESSHTHDKTEKVDQHKLDSWKTKWSTNTTRWHKNEIHPTLLKYYDRLFPSNENQQDEETPAVVFVPLCGKTIDMAYLVQAKNKYVIGVDCSELAMEQFSSDNPDLSITKNDNKSSGFAVWEGPFNKLLCGDFFSLQANDVGRTVDVVWDRASLVAIQPSLREKYIQVMGRILTTTSGTNNNNNNNGKTTATTKKYYLLSAFVRDDPNSNEGPPYSVPEKEVRRLFGSQPWVESIELLETRTAWKDEPTILKKVQIWWRLGTMQEQVYLITIKV